MKRDQTTGQTQKNLNPLKTYRITIPAFSEEIEAKNKEEALEVFWFDLDQAQTDENFMQPVVEELSTAETRTHNESCSESEFPK